MPSRLILRLDTDPDAGVSWLHQDGAGQALDHGVSTDLAELAARLSDASGAGAAQVIALAPGTRVLLTRASVPTQNRQKLLRALPYALEDQLADDIERLHFAIGRREPDGAWPVAVLERAWLDAWLARLKAHGLAPARLLPEVLCLPRLPGNWSVLTETATALVRTGDQSGFAGDRPNLDTLLSVALDEPGSQAPTEILHLAEDRKAGLDLPPELADTPLVQRHAPDVLTLLSAGINNPLALNLLVDGYAAARGQGSLWRPWAAAAALFVVWLVLDTGHTVLEQRSMRAELAALDTQATALLRQVFPQARDAGQARSRLEARLQQLRGGGGQRQGGLLEALVLVGPTLKAGENVTLTGLNWRSGDLELELTTSNLQSLDRLKQSLDGTDGLSAEVRSARTENDQTQGTQTQGRLTVRRTDI